MPRRKPHTRESIQKIRETIDTAMAIKTLHEIAHDEKNPLSVRVKALNILLDKTMPSMTESMIEQVPQEPMNHEQLQVLLVSLVGPELAAKLLKEMGAEKPKHETQH